MTRYGANKGPGEKLSWEEYKSMVFTQHVITESVRMSTPLNLLTLGKSWKIMSHVLEDGAIRGDPRNFALLGHWDGFQSARTRQRPCWTLEVEILNAGKVSSLGPIPILFIPASSGKIIKHGDGSVLNAFLEPFIQELEDMFIKGFPVANAYPPHLISEHLELGCGDGSVTLRAMLMMFAGDLKAQCKIGNLSDGGYGGCRRHKVPLESRRNTAGSRSSLMYCDTRKEARYSHPPRSCESILAAAIEWQELHPGPERLEVERKGGISGYSIMWSLHNLYGFDVSLDLVHDVMHTLSLNILKKYVALLVGSMTTVGRMDELERALAIATQHKPKGLGGRWPRKLKSLGYYKAEEYQLFVMWCLPYILDHLDLKGDTVLGGVGMILIEICRLFHSHARKYGWTKTAMETARGLLSAWRVRIAESVGPNSSPLEHIAGSGELLDDVVHHGCHDIFWCYAFEREVSNYMAIPTNQKANEVSYLYYYSRQFFTKTFSYIKLDKDGLWPSERITNEVHKFLFKSQQVNTPAMRIASKCDDWHQDRVIVVHSQKTALILSKMLPKLEPCACKSLIEEKGICVGPKYPVVKQATRPMALYLEEFWRNLGVLSNLNVSFFTLDLYRISFVLIQGIEYRVGDLVLVQPDSSSMESTDHSWTWKAKILAFYIHELHGKMQVFFAASYFEQRMEDHCSNMPLVHCISGMQILNSQPKETSLRPVQQLLHKFMQLPIPQQQYVVAYELEDVAPRTHLLEVGQPGCVPPFPEINDLMLVKKQGWERGDPFLYGIVLQVTCAGSLGRGYVASVGIPVERDELVGTVELCLLCPLGPRSKRFVRMIGGNYNCSWHMLVKRVLTFKVTKRLHGNPVEWNIDD